MATAQELATQLSQFDSSTPSATDIYNNVTTQLGIPDARTRVQALQKNLIDTQNAIDAVDPNVTARTSGSLVTDAQRGRLVNMEKQPLSENYAKENQNYGTESGNLNTLLGEANTQVGNINATNNSKRQSLLDQLGAAQKAEADAENKRQFDASLAIQQQNANTSASKAASSSSSTVNPQKDFLDYISQQFKAAGKNPSRQSQDAWADAFFAAHNIPVSARNAYWNLFNTTYKRPNDPTKDWLYKR